MEDQNYSKHIKKLTSTLLVSAFLNIVFLALLFYFLAKETTPRPYFELKPANKEQQQTPLATEGSTKEILQGFRSISLEQLINKLSDLQQVENGFAQRDLALSALIAFHHFDLPRALLGKPQPAQQRDIPLGKNSRGFAVHVKIYPGLSEEQYEAITHFAKTERWPLTSRGLFILLRKQGIQYDHSLAEAFFLTPEFLSVETLFSRSEKKIEKHELLHLLNQGNWKMLTTFFSQQKAIQDLSPARRQRFLLDYIEQHSQAAAVLLLKTDGIFAATKLDDAHTISVLKLLNEKTPEAEKFAQRLLLRPRSDAVWYTAAERLYFYAGETLPEQDVHQTALKRFVADTVPLKSIVKSGAKKQQQSKVIAQQTSLMSKKQSTKAVAVNPPNVAAAVVVKKESPEKKIASAEKKTIPPIEKKTAPAEKCVSYIVQEGDSLWKISRKYKVPVEVLKKYNKLQSDSLKPGTTLRIPVPQA